MKLVIFGAVMIFLIAIVSSQGLVVPSGAIPINGSTLNTNHSNSSDYANNWITDEGIAGTVNGSWFEIIGDILTIKLSQLIALGNGEWLGLDQNNWQDDSLGYSFWDGDSLETNETRLDEGINSFGYNHTENLTIFYDQRYLTGELALYFYNGTSPLNSSYTIMNTTIPIEETQIDSFENLINGDNLLTRRILSGLNLTILEKGAYNQHTTIDYVAGNKDVSMRSELYILYENGTEVLIGQSPPSIGLIIGIYQQIIWSGTINEDIIFPEGSHLTMYLYATVVGSGQAPDLDLIVGAGTAARLDIGINPTDIKTIEVDPFSFYKDGSTPMQGNTDIGGFNITNTNDVNSSSFTLNDTTINDWDDISSNVSINFGANESDTSGPSIPFLLTNEGVLKIDVVDSGSGSTIWEQVLSEIRNSVGNVLNFTGSLFVSESITTNDRYYLGNNASIGGNSTCAFIFYNQTGSVIKTEGCT